MYIFERELEAESESGKNRCIIIQFLDKNGFMRDAIYEMIPIFHNSLGVQIYDVGGRGLAMTLRIHSTVARLSKAKIHKSLNQRFEQWVWIFKFRRYSISL